MATQIRKGKVIKRQESSGEFSARLRKQREERRAKEKAKSAARKINKRAGKKIAKAITDKLGRTEVIVVQEPRKFETSVSIKGRERKVQGTFFDIRDRVKSIQEREAVRELKRTKPTSTNTELLRLVRENEKKQRDQLQRQRESIKSAVKKRAEQGILTPKQSVQAGLSKKKDKSVVKKSADKTISRKAPKLLIERAPPRSFNQIQSVLPQNFKLAGQAVNKLKEQIKESNLIIDEKGLDRVIKSVKQSPKAIVIAGLASLEKIISVGDLASRTVPTLALAAFGQTKEQIRRLDFKKGNEDTVRALTKFASNKGLNSKEDAMIKALTFVQSPDKLKIVNDSLGVLFPKISPETEKKIGKALTNTARNVKSDPIGFTTSLIGDVLAGELLFRGVAMASTVSKNIVKVGAKTGSKGISKGITKSIDSVNKQLKKVDPNSAVGKNLIKSKMVLQNAKSNLNKFKAQVKPKNRVLYDIVLKEGDNSLSISKGTNLLLKKEKQILKKQLKKTLKEKKAISKIAKKAIKEVKKELKPTKIKAIKKKINIVNKKFNKGLEKRIDTITRKLKLDPVTKTRIKNKIKNQGIKLEILISDIKSSELLNALSKKLSKLLQIKLKLFIKLPFDAQIKALDSFLDDVLKNIKQFDLDRKTFQNFKFEAKKELKITKFKIKLKSAASKKSRLKSVTTTKKQIDKFDSLKAEAKKELSRTDLKIKKRQKLKREIKRIDAARLKLTKKAIRREKIVASVKKIKEGTLSVNKQIQNINKKIKADIKNKIELRKTFKEIEKLPKGKSKTLEEIRKIDVANVVKSLKAAKKQEDLVKKIRVDKIKNQQASYIKEIKDQIIAEKNLRKDIKSLFKPVSGKLQRKQSLKKLTQKIKASTNKLRIKLQKSKSLKLVKSTKNIKQQISKLNDEISDTIDDLSELRFKFEIARSTVFEKVPQFKQTPKQFDDEQVKRLLRVFNHAVKTSNKIIKAESKKKVKSVKIAGGKEIVNGATQLLLLDPITQNQVKSVVVGKTNVIPKITSDFKALSIITAIINNVGTDKQNIKIKNPSTVVNNIFKIKDGKNVLKPINDIKSGMKDNVVSIGKIKPIQKITPKDKISSKGKIRRKAKISAKQKIIAKEKFIQKKIIKTRPKIFRRIKFKLPKKKLLKVKIKIRKILKEVPPKFRPSLQAIILGITAEKIPGTITGVEIRPIIKKLVKKKRDEEEEEKKKKKKKSKKGGKKVGKKK